MFIQIYIFFIIFFTKVSGLDKIIYLENTIVSIGVDLSKGCAIVKFAQLTGPNLINAHDDGRNIQV
jgi:hypothetical protein